MSVWQTVLVYGVIPLAVFLVLALLTLPGGRRRPRWRSGQAWEHEPVWYEPHPEALGNAGGHANGHADGHAALGTGSGATALTAGSEAQEARPAVGGARGTW